MPPRQWTRVINSLRELAVDVWEYYRPHVSWRGAGRGVAETLVHMAPSALLLFVPFTVFRGEEREQAMVMAAQEPATVAAVFAMAVGCWVTAGLGRYGAWLFVLPGLPNGFAAQFRTYPGLSRGTAACSLPPSYGLPLLGRRWPVLVLFTHAAVALVVIGGAVFALDVLAVRTIPYPAWYAFYALSALLAFRRTRGKDETDRLKGYVGVPRTWDVDREYRDKPNVPRLEVALKTLDYLEQSRRFYEIHGLSDPAPATYTQRQRDAFAETYSQILERIAVEEEGIERLEEEQVLVTPCDDVAEAPQVVSQ